MQFAATENGTQVTQSPSLMYRSLHKTKRSRLAGLHLPPLNPLKQHTQIKIYPDSYTSFRSQSLYHNYGDDKFKFPLTFTFQN